MRGLARLLRRTCTRLLCWLLLALPAAPLPAVETWGLQLSRVQSGDLNLSGISGRLQARADGGWALLGGSLRATYAGEDFGTVDFDAATAEPGLTGSLRWRAGDGLQLEGEWSIDADGSIRAELARRRLLVEGTLDALRLRLSELPVEPWRRWLGRRLGFTPARLEGRLSAELALQGERLSGSLRLAGAGFDTDDGLRAAAGVAAELAVDTSAQWPWQLTANAGEVLWDQLYVALPEAGLRLLAAAQDDGWRVEASESGVFELDGSLGGGASPDWRVQLQVADLQRWHDRYLAGYLQARAWSTVVPQGQLALQAQGRGEQPQQASLQGQLTALEMAGMRVQGLQLDGAWSAAGQGHLRASAQDTRWGELPLSGWQLQAAQDGDRWSLQAPVQLALLGGQASLGALRVDLAQRPWQAQASLSLRQIDVAGLMQALGWTPLPGQLSADFPGVGIEPQRIALQGGAEVQAFGGQVSLGAIEIERPLGPAPAISGGFEFDGLDLQGVTAAFGFGEIEGRLQGHVRDLRLVDGRPVAFDAWLASDPEYRGQRRISQRAIDNLSAVGGGPGGAMSRSFLRVFETFRYDAIGLGCRLYQGTCQMRGLEAGNGGYMIVRGAGLPRITVMGHATRVNWTSLVNRLLAATRSEGVRVE